MIITENEKNFVVFSSLFERSFPNLKSEIWNIIRSYHKSLGVVAHTRDYWARDYMPIQVEESVFIKFAYNPDYLQDHKGYITDVDKELATIIPTPLDMGAVYQRLIINTLSSKEDYVDGIIRVYNDDICDVIDNYNCSAFYEPSYVMARAYQNGGF